MHLKLIYCVSLVGTIELYTNQNVYANTAYPNLLLLAIMNYITYLVRKAANERPSPTTHSLPPITLPFDTNNSSKVTYKKMNRNGTRKREVQK
jgi:hypothetical protein